MIPILACVSKQKDLGQESNASTVRDAMGQIYDEKQNQHIYDTIVKIIQYVSEIRQLKGGKK